MTSQEALLELDGIEFKNLSSEAKITRLEELAKSLSADTSDSKTIFYSGTIDGQSTGNIAKAIAKADVNARIIDNTEVGKFLGDIKFRETLAEAMNIDLEDFDAKTVPSNLLNKYNSRLYNTDPANGKLGF